MLTTKKCINCKLNFKALHEEKIYCNTAICSSIDRNLKINKKWADKSLVSARKDPFWNRNR